jgi:hypothetical protein
MSSHFNHQILKFRRRPLLQKLLAGKLFVQFVPRLLKKLRLEMLPKEVRPCRYDDAGWKNSVTLYISNTSDSNMPPTYS